MAPAANSGLRKNAHAPTGERASSRPRYSPAKSRALEYPINATVKSRFLPAPYTCAPGPLSGANNAGARGPSFCATDARRL